MNTNLPHGGNYQAGSTDTKTQRPIMLIGEDIRAIQKMIAEMNKQIAELKNKIASMQSNTTS